jgi:hypothetical protein
VVPKSGDTKSVVIPVIGTILVAIIAAIGGYFSNRTSAARPDETTAAAQTPHTPQPSLTYPFPLDSKFFPSGWMGDGRQGTKYLVLTFVSADVNGENRIVNRIDYSPGPDGWAGVYWQYPNGNWGTHPGMSLAGASAISFLARGENGGEVVEFKSGGIQGAHSDSYERSLGKVSLERSWTAYQIPLAGQDLSNVIGAFALSAPAPPTRMTFYIANLEVR